MNLFEKLHSVLTNKKIAKSATWDKNHDDAGALEVERKAVQREMDSYNTKAGNRG